MALVPRSLESDFFSPFFSSGWDFPTTLGQFLGPPSTELGTTGQRGMPVDVVEKDKEFEVKADIPGVHKSDIKVTVDKDVLRINVEKTQEKREEKEQAGRKYHRWERSSTFVGRALRMPDAADLDKIKAKYENGTLTLDIPKKPEAVKEAKRITVG